MPTQSRTNRLDLNACACTAWVLTCAGRVLLIWSAFSLVTMPITERLWTWDRFFQTGRDFELGMILLLTFLCLVLVLSAQGKHGVEFLLSIGRWVAFRSTAHCASRIRLAAGAPARYVELRIRTGVRNFPLLI